MPERGDWFGRAALVVGAVTLARIAALWFNRTDLFVDESQYWLWGQRLDFGYYSKPPLIAWVIRAVTDLAGSDAPFWVRLPGAVFHGATALILGALAARLYSARAAFWVAVSYVTLPMVALGSILISTDTIMAPFFAAALLFHFRAADSGRAGYAALAGGAIGLAFLAKYAAVYFLLGAGLAALLVPAMRLPLRGWVALLTGFGLVILPNILWNLSHDLTTVSHTMDNVGWVRGGSWLAGLNPAGLAEFFFSQFAVIGPVLFGALLWGFIRPGGHVGLTLVLFSLPIVLIVCTQALLERAYANWGVAAYFAGTVLAVGLLHQRAPKLLAASVAINAAVSVLLPVLAITAPFPESGGKPLLARYLGRHDLSHQVIAEAERLGVQGVLATQRDILADLFYAGRDAGLDIYAPPPGGRPDNYYEQNFPLPPDHGAVLLVGKTAPDCAGAPVGTLDTEGGAYHGRELSVWLLPEGCNDDAR